MVLSCSTGCTRQTLTWFASAGIRWNMDIPLTRANEMRFGLLWLSLLAGQLQRASLAASTGIETADEVVKYLLAGADAVMTTSALLRDGPAYLRTLATDLETWLQARDIESVTAIKGRMRESHPASEAQAHERSDDIRSLLNYRGAYVQR
jgi:dihydroorotate dehydrogenase (fumarate)